MNNNNEFQFCSKESKIEGTPAFKWLAKNQEISVFFREDGILVRNICCCELLAGKDGKEKYVPMAGTVILHPKGENTFIRISGHMFYVCD